jgi:hypothetical protein
VWPDATNLLLRAQAADNVNTFTTATNNISSRPLGTKSATWVPPLWNVVDEAGPNQQTPSLVRVLSEVVNRPGWASGNAMAIIVTGTGRRVAKAFESDALGAPMLHVDFITATNPLAVGDEPGLDFALGVRPSPTRGPLGLELTLARSERATVELLDVSGRRVVFRDLGAMTPGRHRIELRDPLPAGLYVVRLTQGGTSRTAKAVVLR